MRSFTIGYEKLLLGNCLNYRLCPGADVRPSVHRFQIRSYGRTSVPAKGLALTLSDGFAYLPAHDLSNPSSVFCMLLHSWEEGYCSAEVIALTTTKSQKERCQKLDWLDSSFFLFQLLIIVKFLNIQLSCLLQGTFSEAFQGTAFLASTSAHAFKKNKQTKKPKQTNKPASIWQWILT